ncbi:MAG: hypothetical protein GY832_15445 [Chloroflexi bacterium]|nr:hypothetical protein [Chloroflexota bacterium]
MPELTARETEIFAQTLRTGNWDIFTEPYFQLPKSGTWYTPEDRVEQYGQLYDVWASLGKPDSQMFVEVDGTDTAIHVSWDYVYYGDEPLFLLPHGFRMLPWLREFLAPSIPLGIAITGTGTGKAQNLDAKILTPKGWTTMGDIQKGDYVVGRDGLPKKVLGVYPQGIRPIYRVTFSDGSSTAADNEHLWLVDDGSKRNWQVVETRELLSARQCSFIPSLSSYHLPLEADNSTRRVTSVEYIGDMEAQCIDVEDDLYVTDDYIVTHNTAGTAIFGLMCCALLPGFRFLNVAPTTEQASFMLAEIEKWAGNTAFRRFIRESRGANPLWKEKPHPTVTIEVYPGYPSTFVCQTVGRDATGIQGGERDFINFDEAGLLENIEQAIPILITRLRGTRSTGDPRWTMLRWISNPSQNPELLTLLENYEKKQQTSGNAIALRDVHSSVNVYLTQKQIKQQAEAMDSRMADRWHGGSMEAAFATVGIAERLIEGCKNEDLDATVKQVGEYDDGLGLQHYLLPPKTGHIYMVVGDVGKSSLTSMSSMNVPCVMVMDVTDFLERPIDVVAMWWKDGNGSYKTFVDWMKAGMLHYRAAGYYDAQNVQTALEDLSGGFENWPTTPVYLSGQARGKSWGLTVMTQLMDDEMFAWPYIKALWYQARIYDPKSQKKADDIIATLLTFAMALQVEGALWDKLAARYKWVLDGNELKPEQEGSKRVHREPLEAVEADRYWRMG